MKQLIIFIIAFSLSSTLIAQKNYEKGSRVRIHTLGDVQHLNPLTATDAQSTIIAMQLHQTLYGIDPISHELVPILAKQKAKHYIQNNLHHYEFEIRKEAKWDNGSYITGHDLVFSLKLNFVPEAETEHIRPYLDYIEDIIIDNKNPNRFTIICKRPYMSSENSIAANQYILPQYIYDPEKVLDHYTVKELLSDNYDTNLKLKKDKKLIDYADFFNGSLFKNKIVSGSGPYKFVKWNKNDKIEFKRKKKWWGDKVKTEDKNSWFIAFPEYIEYITLSDLNTALDNLISGNIDAMHSVPPNRFIQLREKRPNDFHYLTPVLFSYDYIGIHTRNPILSNIEVRYALTHLINIDKLIEEEMYGLGQRSKTFIHPEVKGKINPKLVYHDFNIQKAKNILLENGWSDTNQDGILDKIINGERQSLSLNIHYNYGNQRRRKTCELLKTAAEKIGIEINILSLEWVNYLDKINKHDFDLHVGGWVSSPMESDPRQIWHTKSYDGGSNYTGFGNKETDKIIDELIKTPEYEKRISLYYKLQEEIDKERPYIFLLNRFNTVIISKKFTNAYGTGLRSGIFPQHLKLVK